jgi:radical SAM superfamily enzyme YgiQ (UPF0313 family)
MRYEGTVYRPPSEGRSLILQATIGCSYNRCSYCAMYLEKRFRQRSREDLLEDMAIAQATLGAESVRKVFLADGDALIMRTPRLLQLLEDLRDHFPEFQQASVYASPQALLSKSVQEIRELKEAGLPLYYLGTETGHPKVMERIAKGVTPAQMVDAASRVTGADAKLSVIMLLGIGGTELSHEHAVESGRIVSAMDPRFVSTLTITPVPGTKFHEEVESGRVELPDDRGILRELRTMVENMDVTRAIYRGNHASNSLPLGGVLPRQKDEILAVLDQVIADTAIPLRARPSPRHL